MADSEDVKVWSYHALEQWEEKCGPGAAHHFAEDNTYRQKMLDLRGVDKVLDYGCGSGLWKPFFDGRDYYGVDQNHTMIEYAHKRWPEVADKFSVVSGDRTDFPDENFDLVFTSAVLQHNKHPRKTVVVKELYRLLKQGGYYFCTENTFREDNFRVTFKTGPYHAGLDDGYSFTPEGWKNFMLPLGFETVWYQSPGFYLYRKV